ncbi:S-layer protein [Natronorubrum sp. JWXQ-INN-674]|uniref:S-layer protein n=1 Tax=Natronorubrum halalkaliphilum TaxID=2691917 RepID=A0A6B0VJF4_9EURY|nr:S-layer protein [Natronorubrum halalkaliphilum]MXV61658.1 S-layer protein [Natronorubrum halalkaliphilum]
MVRRTLTRRRFGATLTALATVGLAGCSDDETADDENDDSDPFELDDPGALTINFENEDGDPVSSGLEITVRNEDEGFTANFGDDVDEGTVLAAGLIYEGEYDITVESADDEFDTVEETVTLDEDDETVTIVLEGAPADPMDEDDE